MAVTVSKDQRRHTHSPSKMIEVVTFTWTSDGSGDASTTVDLNGWLVKAVTNPDDTAAPTDNYDITLVDENSIDAADSNIINRDTANTEQVYPVATAASGVTTPILLSGSHTFTVANAGASKSGVCKLYLASEV